MCYHLVVKVRFHHLWVLLEIFLRPSCSFRNWEVSILPSHLRNKGSTLGNDLTPKPKFGKKKAQNDSVTFSLSPFMFLHYLFVLLSCFWVNLVLCFVCLHVFVCLFSVLFHFVLHKNKNKIEKLEKKIQKLCAFLYIGSCVPWMTIETKFSKLCISCNLDEHFNA